MSPAATAQGVVAHKAVEFRIHGATGLDPATLVAFRSPPRLPGVRRSIRRPLAVAPVVAIALRGAVRPAR